MSVTANAQSSGPSAPSFVALGDRQRLLVALRRLVVAALRLVGAAEIVERDSGLEVVVAERLLKDRNGALEQAFAASVVPNV
jgi:2-phospho-L-lactate guanylyltransferase (CobY/MobA/RfbA family)